MRKRQKFDKARVRCDFAAQNDLAEIPEFARDSAAPPLVVSLHRADSSTVEV
jgi:hypothetical protein